MKGRTYEITRNRKYDRSQRALVSLVYKLFDKKTGLGVSVNEQLAEKLHKPVVKKIQKKKI